MRVLALDIGEKRIGVAVSDPSRTVATPVTVLDAAAVAKDGRPFARLMSDYDDIDLMVVGLPVSLDGAEGPQAARVRRVAGAIAENLGLPVEFIDERLTSVEASRRMAEAGSDSRRQRGAVDMVAASIMLQAYLESKKGRWDE